MPLPETTTRFEHVAVLYSLVHFQIKSLTLLWGCRLAWRGSARLCREGELKKKKKKKRHACYKWLIDSSSNNCR